MSRYAPDKEEKDEFDVECPHCKESFRVKIKIGTAIETTIIDVDTE